MEKGDSKKSDTNLPSRAEFRTPSGIEVEACYRPLGSSGHDEKNERNKRMTHAPRLAVPSGAEITEFAHCGFKSAL